MLRRPLLLVFPKINQEKEKQKINVSKFSRKTQSVNYQNTTIRQSQSSLADQTIPNIQQQSQNVQFIDYMKLKQQKQYNNKKLMNKRQIQLQSTKMKKFFALQNESQNSNLFSNQNQTVNLTNQIDDFPLATYPSHNGSECFNNYAHRLVKHLSEKVNTMQRKQQKIT